MAGTAPPFENKKIEWRTGDEVTTVQLRFDRIAKKNLEDHPTKEGLEGKSLYKAFRKLGAVPSNDVDRNGRVTPAVVRLHEKLHDYTRITFMEAGQRHDPTPGVVPADMRRDSKTGLNTAFKNYSFGTLQAVKKFDGRGRPVEPKL